MTSNVYISCATIETTFFMRPNFVLFIYFFEIFLLAFHFPNYFDNISFETFLTFIYKIFYFMIINFQYSFFMSFSIHRIHRKCLFKKSVYFTFCKDVQIMLPNFTINVREGLNSLSFLKLSFNAFFMYNVRLGN